MDDRQNDSGLLLPDLYIENFRGIKKLTIPRLGRVTLLAGRNGVGKTTVLDAIRVYAARGGQHVLAQILSSRDEVIELKDQSFANGVELDWMALFHGRDMAESLHISIGPKKESDQLRIVSTLSDLDSSAPDQVPPTFLPDGTRIRIQTLIGDFSGHRYYLVSSDSGIKYHPGKEPPPPSPPSSLPPPSPPSSLPPPTSPLPPPTKFEFLGPGLLPQSDIARMWDVVALTDDEDLITKSIKLVFGEGVDRLAVVGGFSRGGLGAERRAIVRLRSNAGPVPLKSLGEGASRLFGVALAFASVRDGFLLIDEAENGIHHSVQRDYWRMVLQTARENNLQVFATTHSWDCVRGFAQAAAENVNVEGVLVRLEKEDDGLRAVRYSERRLKIAAEQRIEVR